LRISSPPFQLKQGHLGQVTQGYLSSTRLTHVSLHHVQQHLRTVSIEQLHTSFTVNAPGIPKPDLPYGPKAWASQSKLLCSYRSPSLKHSTAKDPDFTSSALSSLPKRTLARCFILCKHQTNEVLELLCKFLDQKP